MSIVKYLVNLTSSVFSTKNGILLYLFCGILLYLIMRKYINNYLDNHILNNKENMEYKLEKYEYKLNTLQKIYYYFNTYGTPVPEKYKNLLKVLHLPQATDNEYSNIRKQGDQLAKDNHSARLKFNIGSFNTICTIFSMNDNIVDSVINFMITDDNKCYIETICYNNDNILLNKLKEICKEYGVINISTFSIYQPDTNFLLQNGFVLNENRYLVYNM